MTGAIDLKGKIFGDLTVLERSSQKFHSNIGWDCVCSCGTHITVNGVGLRKGETKNCGCKKVEIGPKDITGKRFGRLVAVNCTGEQNKGGNFIWNFVCDYGNTTTVPSGGVVFGSTQSCGCYALDSPNKGTHRLSKTKEYRSWCHAKERTTCPSCKNYADYGGSGITMSDEFINSFEVFIEHVGRTPKDGLRYTLGRIDNDGNYERGNIRWETDTQQARNKGFQRNNTSGKSGVTWDNKVWKNGEKLYAKAQWQTLEGKLNAKRYSVNVYGILPAFAMACAYREKMIEELNAQGAGYSDKHGL